MIIVSEKPRVLYLVIGVVLIVGLIVGLRSFFRSMHYVSTDDAMIVGHIVDVSPKVSGQVLKVYVNDNQRVKKGDLLLEIDPRDYQARLDEAEASLRTALSNERVAEIGVGLTSSTSRAGVLQETSGVRFAESGVHVAQAQAMTAESQLDQAEAEYTASVADEKLANTDLTRYQQLYSRDEVSKQQLDQAVDSHDRAHANLEVAREKVEAAKENLRQAKALVAAAKAQVGQAVGRFKKADVVPDQVAQSKAQHQSSLGQAQQASAALQMAKLNLSYTKIYAPESGQITKKSVEEGNYVQTGQLLLSVVPDNVWVVANFKETQLTQIRKGQPVEVRVDTYPHKVFQGHVDSIQSGTGSAFSLLPPENATGNYVKVVQRVPVKILLDEAPDPNYLLAPGMSAVPDVRIK